MKINQMILFSCIVTSGFLIHGETSQASSMLPEVTIEIRNNSNAQGGKAEVQAVSKAQSEHTMRTHSSTNNCSLTTAQASSPDGLCHCCHCETMRRQEEQRRSDARQATSDRVMVGLGMFLGVF